MNSPARLGFIRAGWYAGISILDESRGRIPGSAGHPAPACTGASWRRGTAARKAEGSPEGRPVPATQASEGERTQSKMNTTVKSAAAIQEAGSAEHDKNHTNFSQQLPGIVLHCRNPMCWYLQALFSTRIPAYRKHQKMVSLPG